MSRYDNVFYEPMPLKHGFPRNPFKSVLTRPIRQISTLSEDGVYNQANDRAYLVSLQLTRLDIRNFKT